MPWRNEERAVAGFKQVEEAIFLTREQNGEGHAEHAAWVHEGPLEVENEQLHDALEHRADIGIAIGRIMQRYGVDRHQALSTLRRLSQQRNEKVRDIAADLAAGKDFSL